MMMTMIKKKLQKKKYTRKNISIIQKWDRVRSMRLVQAPSVLLRRHRPRFTQSTGYHFHERTSVLKRSRKIETRRRRRSRRDAAQSTFTFYHQEYFCVTCAASLLFKAHTFFKYINKKTRTKKTLFS